MYKMYHQITKLSPKEKFKPKHKHSFAISKKKKKIYMIEFFTDRILELNFLYDKALVYMNPCVVCSV